MFLREKDIYLASKVANYVAGKSVQVLGNYSLSINDIIEYGEKQKIIYDYEIDKIMKLGANKNIVFTNGCFDIIHSAHIKLLKFAKKQGDLLVLGLNSDQSIKRLKGVNRPINDINERVELLINLDIVDYIIIFDTDTPLDIIKYLKPNTLIKGGDYKKENIVGREYVNNILLFDYINNKSTSLIVEKIKLSYNIDNGTKSDTFIQ